MKVSGHILPIIVFSQFCCTTIWFAGNGVMDNLVSHFQLNESAIGHLTSAVQFGFIMGTLIFAAFSISDQYSPSKVFFFSAVAASVFNVSMIAPDHNIYSLTLLRFLSGFFLAGIYPVGMKIASDYYEKALGKSLGFLVGALVLGTAFPHLLKGLLGNFPWKWVILLTSALALLGGLLMLLWVPDGPGRKTALRLDFLASIRIFKNKSFRSAAFGYFGHMWELYTFWAFIPIILKTYSTLHPEQTIKIPLLSFTIIGVGGLSCIFGGYVAQCWNTKKTATLALSLSCACCLLSPFMYQTTFIPFIGFLLFWGMAVVADSPLFSTLVAQNTPSHLKGTALTFVNGIGFAITVISIQLFTFLSFHASSTSFYALLSLGPILGLFALIRTSNYTVPSKSKH